VSGPGVSGLAARRSGRGLTLKGSVVDLVLVIGQRGAPSEEVVLGRRAVGVVDAEILGAVGVVDAKILGLGGLVAVEVVLRIDLGARVGVVVDRLALGAADQRGLELVDFTRGVLELAGYVGAPRLRRRRAGMLRAPRLALLGSLSITGHGDRCALARLPMAGVLTAPLAVLAQGDAIRIVALGLVRLVVAPLALLAGEGDSDTHVSAGHLAAPW
jgi:hypothetical protein